MAQRQIQKQLSSIRQHRGFLAWNGSIDKVHQRLMKANHNSEIRRLTELLSSGELKGRVDPTSYPFYRITPVILNHYPFLFDKLQKRNTKRSMEPAYYNKNYPPPGPTQPNPYNQQQPYGYPQNPPGPYAGAPAYHQPTQPSGPAVVYHVNVNNQRGACPSCGRNASVMPIRQTSTTQWIWCFVIFLLFWPCCWVPFVMDRCNDIRYVCSNCQYVRSWYRAPCC